MHVLVVEDDASSSAMLGDALRSRGYTVSRAGDGLEALQLLQTHTPDLIISDILMPNMDGYAFCRKVKANPRLRTIPFIFYTATYVEPADESLALSLGADRFLVKPVEIPQLLVIVADLLGAARRHELPSARREPLDDATADDLHVARLNAKLAEKVEELSAQQRALQLSETRFRDFAEIAADWFWETDDTLGVVYSSRYAEVMVGRRLGEFLRAGQDGEVSKAAGEAAAALGEMLATRQTLRSVEVEFPTPDGRHVLRVSGRPVYDEGSRFLGYRGVCRDDTEAAELVRQISHDASHDDLTGLLNRREFDLRLRNAFDSHRRYGTPSQVCFMDLDQFKVVNDTAGHMAGDAMLTTIARQLSTKLRTRDTLARLGGDEFGLILENCPLEKAIEICETMVALVASHQFVWEGRSFNSGISVGIADVGEAADDYTELLARADVACYAAKESGRNRVAVYDPGGQGEVRHADMFRATEIRSALDAGRGSLYAQPIIPLHSEAGPLHVELLLRLGRGDGGLLLPTDFIPAAERYGGMGALDRWVVGELIHRTGAAFTALPDAVFCANLSGTSFGDRDFLDFLRREIEQAEIDPSRLCFEITETAAIRNLEAAASSIAAIRDLGCQFALDDFGSGACSFTYLKKLPVDLVKIDGSFVRDIASDSVDHALVSSIAGIASVMGIRTVAEMVEDHQVIKLLRDIGVDYAQGNGIARPTDLDTVCRSFRDFVMR